MWSHLIEQKTDLLRNSTLIVLDAITFTHIYKTMRFSAPEIWLKYAEQGDFIDNATSYHTQNTPFLPEYSDIT